MANCQNESWTASDGFHTIRIWVNDSAGNKNVSVANFTIDTVIPNIMFVSPTPASGTGQTANYTYINVSVNDTDPMSSFIDITNSTGQYLLVGYWNFNNNTLDGSTYGNNATAMAVRCSPSDIGKFGSACLFGATQNYGIVIPYTTQNSLNESVFTVESWVMHKGTVPS